jgi:hypothetical protein
MRRFCCELRPASCELLKTGREPADHLAVSDQPAIPLPPEAPREAGLSLRVLQIGAVAVVLTATLHRTYELDRFLLPKELVLHLVAFLAAAFAFRALRNVVFERVDLLLLLYLAASVASAAAATNRWLGFRALAVSVSALLVFWVGRAVTSAGRGDALRAALAFAIVVAAGTALLQTYGVEIDLFSRNRAPGGTLGNRNFIGHAAAFGLPVVLLQALRARTIAGHLCASVGVAAVGGVLVLTRSRAAWVAAAAVGVVFVFAMLAARVIRGDGRSWRRILTITVIAIAGIAAALLLPNTLRWRSENPYLDSVRGVASYDEGSGRGRLIQYERSLRMLLSNPIVGVGPGNWPVVYPAYAAQRDPSLDPSETGMTYNPWPSSDWVAIFSERGVIAGSLFLLATIGIALTGLRGMVRALDRDEALSAAALLATVAGASIAGLFDAVLLLGAPALLVWTTLGVLWPDARRTDATGEREAKPIPRSLVVMLLILTLAGVVRSSGQLTAMELHARGELRRAAVVDPSNYRVRIRLAGTGPRKERCPHAEAARALFPNASEAKRKAASCS